MIGVGVLHQSTSDERAPFGDEALTDRTHAQTLEPTRDEADTARELLDVLGSNAARLLIDAVKLSKKRTAARPGDREVVEIVLQGGNPVEVLPHRERWKVLANRP